MIAVVAPEPVRWLEPVVAAAGGAVRVLAPWALPAWSGPLARALPGAARQAVMRRMAPVDAELSWLPGWIAVEAALRAWARGRTDRDMSARFAVRAAVDVLAAAWLARLEPGPRAVLAPSCAAERTFAAAWQRGVARVLIEDLPDIRQLHDDLDDAARVHPACGFLRRYRAPGRVMARQEAERVLADRLVVRGAHARAMREQAAFRADAIIDLPDGVAPLARAAGRPGTGCVLLAGLAAARHGTHEALAALASRPHLTLLVRPGEGMEPSDLLLRPRVRAATRAEREALEGVDAVMAPAWCEAYAPEVAAAAAAGVPVIATRRGAGHVEPTCVVEPGDAAALGRALDAALTDPAPARLRPGLRGLAPELARLAGRDVARG